MLRKLTFVTTNRGKFDEARARLATIGVEVEQRVQPYPEMQTKAIVDVVESGIVWLRERVRPPFFIEDSGLFIDALKGFPGVYSSYAYKTLGNEKILRLLEGSTRREAHFESCIGYCNPNHEPAFFFGVCHGRLAEQAKGGHGFGFDPIFIPEGRQQPLAEMEIRLKNEVSHRGMALNRFVTHLVREDTRAAAPPAPPAAPAPPASPGRP